MFEFQSLTVEFLVSNSSSKMYFIAIIFSKLVYPAIPLRICKMRVILIHFISPFKVLSIQPGTKETYIDDDNWDSVANLHSINVLKFLSCT